MLRPNMPHPNISRPNMPRPSMPRPNMPCFLSPHLSPFLSTLSTPPLLVSRLFFLVAAPPSRAFQNHVRYAIIFCIA
jgi:hypothetical protein